MADKTLSIQITDDETVINSALNAFVRQNGWNEDSALTQQEKAREVLRGFIMETVKAYNINLAIEQARTAAAAQTEQTISNATMTLTVS